MVPAARVPTATPRQQTVLEDECPIKIEPRSTMKPAIAPPAITEKPM